MANTRRYYAEVCVFLSGGRTLAGSISHNGLQKCWGFHGVEEFIAICESVFDSIDMPQRTSIPRTYYNRNEKPSPISQALIGLYEEENALTELDENYKKISHETPTFVVKVLYRQNATWQGTVKWVETGMEVNFRSLLELVMLMSEAVGVCSPGWHAASIVNAGEIAQDALRDKPQ